MGEFPLTLGRMLRSRHADATPFSLSMTAELFRILDAFGKQVIENSSGEGAPSFRLLAYGDPAVRSVCVILICWAARRCDTSCLQRI